MSDALEQHEQAANRIRDGLNRTLQELDWRLHVATDLRFQLMTHRGLVAVIGGGAVALLAVGLTLEALRERRARRPWVLRRRRVEGFKRAWRHPERLASRARERPLPAALGRRVVRASFGAFVSRIARRTARRVLPV